MDYFKWKNSGTRVSAANSVLKWRCGKLKCDGYFGLGPPHPPPPLGAGSHIFFPSKIRNVIWTCLVFDNEYQLVCGINEQLSMGSTNVNGSSFIAGCHECWICCIKINNLAYSFITVLV